MKKLRDYKGYEIWQDEIGKFYAKKPGASSYETSENSIQGIESYIDSKNNPADKKNSFKMPFDLAEARRAKGQEMFGTTVKNADSKEYVVLDEKGTAMTQAVDKATAETRKAELEKAAPGETFKIEPVDPITKKDTKNAKTLTPEQEAKIAEYKGTMDFNDYEVSIMEDGTAVVSAKDSNGKNIHFKVPLKKNSVKVNVK